LLPSANEAALNWKEDESDEAGYPEHRIRCATAPQSSNVRGLPIALAMSLAGAVAAARNWITSWTASPQGPYPSGSTVAQPNLQFAFPANAASDQTFRLIVRPGLFAPSMRVHFTNVFGSQPVSFNGVFVGLQKTGATLVTGTNAPVTVNGSLSFTLQPGASVWTDPVSLSFVHGNQGDRINLAGRKLGISFHTIGSTGPMTWHATAITTSYATNPNAGSVGNTEGDVFPVSTTLSGAWKASLA
jgi:hypothetical protein